jgi:hypothetical protein
MPIRDAGGGACLHPPGKLDEAAQLSSKIAEHRKQLDEYRQLEESGQGSGRPDHIDFRNPTDEQLRDAQKHGIDLRDPMVAAALNPHTLTPTTTRQRPQPQP